MWKNLIRIHKERVSKEIIETRMKKIHRKGKFHECSDSYSQNEYIYYYI